MRVTERTVSNVMVLASPAEMVEISEQLEAAGFRLGDEVVDASFGTRSRRFPIAGGGFVEVSSEISPGSFVVPGAFGVTPRLASVAYTSDDPVGDLERWRSLPEAAQANAGCRSWRREDGTMGHYVVLIPPPAPGGPAFALRERRLFPLPFAADAATAPPVRRIVVGGRDAAAWRAHHATVFGLPQDGDGDFRAGETDVVFVESDAPAAELSVTFAVANPSASVPLAAGRIELVPLVGE